MCDVTSALYAVTAAAGVAGAVEQRRASKKPTSLQIPAAPPPQAEAYRSPEDALDEAGVKPTTRRQLRVDLLTNATKQSTPSGLQVRTQGTTSAGVRG